MDSTAKSGWIDSFDNNKKDWKDNLRFVLILKMEDSQGTRYEVFYAFLIFYV